MLCLDALALVVLYATETPSNHRVVGPAPRTFPPVYACPLPHAMLPKLQPKACCLSWETFPLVQVIPPNAVRLSYSDRLSKYIFLLLSITDDASLEASKHGIQGCHYSSC
jgi:hypothetical protein